MSSHSENSFEKVFKRVNHQLTHKQNLEVIWGMKNMPIRKNEHKQIIKTPIYYTNLFLIYLLFKQRTVLKGIHYTGYDDRYKGINTIMVDSERNQSLIAIFIYNNQQ